MDGSGNLLVFSLHQCKSNRAVYLGHGIFLQHGLLLSSFCSEHEADGRIWRTHEEFRVTFLGHYRYVDSKLVLLLKKPRNR